MGFVRTYMAPDAVAVAQVSQGEGAAKGQVVRSTSTERPLEGVPAEDSLEDKRKPRRVGPVQGTNSSFLVFVSCPSLDNILPWCL